ncbi:hypothetical protein [Desulfotalea psychrophila]|uniref:Uncharacterized protein n=1 Tax=Desulfotalea psychrophila (strain LSv54 / DSM 12343) TaxID=177439 RepID=Q6AMB0_DESPS|nr:hypothetical protein [Desulfotalea psychrophila]CAG36515.1 unknown protein [Desulfotalea psychrophila LSv54]
MALDIKTLMVCNMGIAFFMAFALLFYRLNYKTYSGYEALLLSIFLAALAYIPMILRGQIPLWLSSILPNFLFFLTAVLRLDAARQFTHNQRLKRRYYCLPLIALPIFAYLSLSKNDIVLRSLFFSIPITAFAIMISRQFYRSKTKENKNLHTAIASLYLIDALFIITRAASWFLAPEERLLNAGSSHQLYFLELTIYEVGIGISWIMLNSQRLETELTLSRKKLLRTVNELTDALAEVKSLSGIIPICMHCKEIRDDRGYWNQLEKFISDHSEAKFSHGICPSCMKEKYPELFDGTVMADSNQMPK